MMKRLAYAAALVILLVVQGAARAAESASLWDWSFDDATGSTVHSKTGKDVGRANGEHRWTSSPHGRALEFNGITGNLRPEGEGHFQIASDEGLSVRAVVRIVKSGETQAIVYGAPTLELEVRSENGVASFNLSSQPGTSARCTGKTPVADGRWHEILAVRDPATRTLRLYIDGQLDNEAPDPTAGQVLPIPRNAMFAGRPDNREMLGGAIAKIEMSRGVVQAAARQATVRNQGARTWTLSNDLVEWRFAAHEGRLTVESVIDRKTGTQFIESEVEAPDNLWQVSLRSPRWPAMLDETQGKLEAKQSATGIVFTWSGLPLGDEKATVTMAVELPAGSAMANWTIDVDHGSKGFGVWQVHCPRISNLRPLSDDPSKNFVAIPTGHNGGAGEGQLFKNPWETLEPVVRTYPCYIQSMQFNAWYGPDAGLYLATHDGKMHTKGFLIKPSATSGSTRALSYDVIHYPADSGVEGTEFHQSYPAVVGVFHGDWYDAARIYRAWALDQVWAQKGPLHQRTDISPWLMRGAWWTVFALERVDDAKGGHLRRLARELPWDEVQRRSRQIDVEASVAKVKKAYDYFGYPILLWCNEWWEGGGDVSPPRYVPMKGLKEMLAELHRQVPDAYFSGHMQAKRYSVQVAEYNDDVKAALEKTPDGSLALEPMDACDKGDQHAYPCWATEFWQKDWQKRAADRVAYGLDGFHMDELGSHTDFTFQCFNREHGHPIGGGTLYADTRRNMVTLIRDSARTQRPGFALHHEAMCEIYIDVADAAEVCTSPSNNNIPLYEAVYHDYSFVMGRRIIEWMDRNTYPMGARNGDELIDEFVSSYAETFVWGNQPSWTRIDIVDYAPKIAAVIKKTMDARYRNLQYLNVGDMMRPLVVTKPLQTVERIWRLNDTPQHTLPVILNSVWKAADGTIAIVLFNITTEPQAISYRSDLAEAGLKGSRFKITRIDGAEPVAMGYADSDKLERTDTVEPYGLMILKVEAAAE